MFYTVLIKEARQLFSDKGFLLIALIQPLIFIVMFGSSFKGGDINHLDTIVIDNDHTNYSQYVIDATYESEFFDPINFSGTLDDALIHLERSEVRAVILIPENFSDNIDNAITGEIEIYIDSSNFLTYSSLSGAQIEIIKESLQRIANDLLGGLEEEKETSKKKIEDIKDIFDEIETEADKLDAELNDIKEEFSGIDSTAIKNSINSLKDALQEEKTSLNQTQNALDGIIFTLADIKAFNQTEEDRKLIVIGQITAIRNGINNSIKDVDDTIRDLDEIDVGTVDAGNISDRIDEKLDSIKNKFESVKEIGESISLNLNKLQKDFLSEPIRIKETAYHGEIKYFDYLGAGVLSLIVFFVSLMAPALNVIYEKEQNTLYRLSTTPVSSIIVFFGKFSVFILFSFFEMLYTLFVAILIYDLRITGSIYNVILILTLLACASISIGLFISSKVKTMQQALVLVPLIVIPSFMISHAFFPPDIMAEFMNYVAYATPMTFSNHALNAIMIKGFSLSEVLPDIYALLAFTIVPLILFIINYKRMRY